MDVFAACMRHLADRALAVTFPHLERLVHIAVVFGIGVHQPRALDRFDQLYGLRHRLAGQHLAHDVLAGVQCPDREGGVLRRIVRQHHRVQIVGDKVVKVFEQRDVLPQLLRLLLRLNEQRLVPVAHGRQLRLRMMQQRLDHRRAACSAEHADPQFFCHG